MVLIHGQVSPGIFQVVTPIIGKDEHSCIHEEEGCSSPLEILLLLGF